MSTSKLKLRVAHLCLLLLLSLVLPRLGLASKTIIFAWIPNPEPEVIGYKILAGTAPGEYTVEYDVGPGTLKDGMVTYSIHPKGGKWFYVCVAYSDKDHSAPSTELNNSWMPVPQVFINVEKNE